MIDEAVLGVLVLLLLLVVYSLARSNALFRRVKELEIRLTELGNHLSEDVAEKISVESQALREEVATRLGSLTACVDRMSSIETRLTEAMEKETDAPDPGATVDAIRPLVREAVESLDGRIRALAELVAEHRTGSAAEIVTNTLHERGFTDIVVTRETVDGDGISRLSVEVRRDGMTFKGPVVMDGTRVVELQLKPSYPMFP